MKLNKNLQNKIKNLPAKPGVYFFYDKNNKLIYIGKAAVLKNRVGSYFTPLRQGYEGQVGKYDIKTEKLVSQICNLKYQITDSVIEALILESNLIKKHQPKYNIREKDDKSFAQIALTNEDFPRLMVIRPTQKINFKIKKLYGPYTSAKAAQEILSIFRKIFTFRDCPEIKFTKHAKKMSPCLFYPLGLCPAPCVGNISKSEYKKIIKYMTDFLQGKRKRVISTLKAQMKNYAKAQRYEEAAKVREMIFAFTHINDVALIKQERSLEQTKNIPSRIECYDISNLGKSFAVGSMVVFTGGEIDKSQYRKFRIIRHSETKPKNLMRSFTNVQDDNHGDTAMMAQVVERRLKHKEWSMPNLILLDGGKGQLSAVLKIMRNNPPNGKTDKINIPVIAVAKGPTRKGFTLFKNSQAKKIVLDKKFIESIRDEAHRFAITYHRKIKNKINY